MPADPKQPFNFEKLFENFNSKIQTNNWWAYADSERIDWFEGQYSAVFTGLFFRAAHEQKEIFELYSNNKAFKLPDDCENSMQESIRLVKNLFDDIKKLGLTPISTTKNLQRKSYKHLRFYHNEDSVLFFITSKHKNEIRFDIRVASFDEQLVNKVHELVHKYADLDPKEPDLFILSEDEEGQLALVSIGKPGTELERGNYNPEAVEGFEYIKKQLSTSDPFGRLVILHGLAGSGKTHLLKSLIYEMKLEKCKFISLHPEFLSRFSIASLTRVLINATSEGESLVILIEDADECLVPRQSDNIAAISTLLNFADGFIGNLLDLRIIATTNAKELSIDEALKRPGRLCKIIDVGKLHYEIANKAYQRISGQEDNPFDKPVVLAEVYEKAYAVKGVVPDVEPPKKLGFAKS